jgi:hypothetical protein
MSVAIQTLAEGTTLILEFDSGEPGQSRLLSHIKGAILGLVNDEGGMMILIKRKGTFEWMDIEDCIPKGSRRNYDDGPSEVVTFPSAG